MITDGDGSVAVCRTPFSGEYREVKLGAPLALEELVLDQAASCRMRSVCSWCLPPAAALALADTFDHGAPASYSSVRRGHPFGVW